MKLKEWEEICIFISVSLSPFPFTSPRVSLFLWYLTSLFPSFFFSAYIISFVCFFLFFFLSFSCSYACFIFFISLPFQFVLYPFIYVSLCECVCLKHFRVPQTAVGARKLQELRRAMKDRKINWCSSKASLLERQVTQYASSDNEVEYNYTC
jgi:hypothetical protein